MLSEYLPNSVIREQQYHGTNDGNDDACHVQAENGIGVNSVVCARARRAEKHPKTQNNITSINALAIVVSSSKQV